MSDSIQEFRNGIRVYRHHLATVNEVGDLYEPETYDLFLSLLAAVPEGGCFVNVGASIGFYTLPARRQYPRLRVHAYEPLSLHRKYFAENVDLNGMQLDDFILHEEGVAAVDGEADFFHNCFGSMSIQKRRAGLSLRLKQVRLRLRRWLQQVGIRNYHLQFSRIRVVSLATVIARAGGGIDLLQMDIQGSEGDVLAGGRELMRAGKVKSILIGTHGAPLHDYCAHLLADCGFEIQYADRKIKGDGALAGVHRSAQQACANKVA